jgi:hypothetical protein
MPKFVNAVAVAAVETEGTTNIALAQIANGTIPGTQHLERKLNVHLVCSRLTAISLLGKG